MTPACDPRPDPGDNPLLPTEFSHVDTHPSLVAPGSFTALDDAATHLLARRTDADEVLVAIDKLGAGSCELPHVSRYRHLPHVTQPAGRHPGYVAFIDDGSDVAELRFATLACEPLPLAIPDGELPLDFTERGEAVVLSAGRLLRGEARTGMTTVLAEEVRRVHEPADAQEPLWVVETATQTILLDTAWTEIDRFGDGVSGVVVEQGGSTLYVSDSRGLQAVVVDANGVRSTEQLEAEACNVAGFAWKDDHTWLAYRSPCAERRFIARAIGAAPARERVDFGPVDVDPSRARIVSYPALPKPRVRLYYLDQPDSETGLSELWAAEPGEAAQHVADGATLEQMWFDSSVFYAVVDIVDGHGRMVASGADGALLEMAVGIPRSSDPQLEPRWFLANSDGSTADLVRVCPGCAAGGTELLAAGVPLSGYRADSWSDFDVAILSQLADGSGTLRLLFQPELLTVDGVPAGQFAFVDNFPLPGLVYVSDYDATRATGRLRYTNYELGASGTVAEQVSELKPLLWPNPGVAFVVPSGLDAGIWFARAK